MKDNVSGAYQTNRQPPSQQPAMAQAPIPLQQPLNPDSAARQAMAYNALYLNGHAEDYRHIAAVLSPPADITGIAPAGSCKGKTVGVIGGGLAGMAAAFELRKAGFDITVFEANPARIGGRIFTYYFDKEKKLYGEFGAMRLPAIHETVWHYIDLFGLETRPFIQTNPNALIYLQGRRVLNDPEGANVRRYIYPAYGLAPWEYNYSWQQLGYYGLEMPVLQAPPEARREILEVLPSYSSYTLDWDAMDIRRAMERQRLSQAAISMLTNLFPIGGRFLYNNYIDFVQEYYPANFTYMYEITGGMVKLPESFHRSFISSEPEKYYKGISAGLLGKVGWKSGSSVTGIYQEQEGGQVTLAYSATGKNDTLLEKFDYIVCAIPFSVLRVLEIQPLFTPLKMQAVREVTYSPAQKTLFRCNRRFWEEQRIYGGGSYTDLPVNTIWYPSHKADSGNEGVLIASYSFNMDSVRLANLPVKAREEKIKRDVEEVHGLAKGWLDPVVTESVTQFWDRDPLYRGTFCYFTPQQKKLFSWNMIQPEYGNRVFFAGEHTSALHRWMQGALESGMEAANALAAAARR